MIATEELERFTATRRALQAVAEHVLSAALHAATGRIGLRQTPGGFGTPPFKSPSGQRQLRVDGTDLVARDDWGERRIPLTTVRDAAALAEVEPGAPADVYTPATPLDLDTPLTLDPAAADRLAKWYELVGQALERLRSESSHEDPAVVQLWPEHFDIATTISNVNYGGSPGDDAHPVPYIYVGPHDPPARDGDFWNEPFGASRPGSTVNSEHDALAFFQDGRRLTT